MLQSSCERVRKCETNTPEYSQVSEEGGGGGGAPGTGAGTCLQKVEKTMRKQFVPLQPIEYHIRDHQENITVGSITLHVLFLILHY